MGDVIEPLDPADTAAITEGTIAPEDARYVDEPDTDTGLDSERIVLLDDDPGSETDPQADSNNNLNFQDTPGFPDQ